MGISKNISIDAWIDNQIEAFYESSYVEKMNDSEKENGGFIIGAFSECMYDIMKTEIDSWNIENVKRCLLVIFPKEIVAAPETFEATAQLLSYFFAFLEEKGELKNGKELSQEVLNLKEAIIDASKDETKWGASKVIRMKTYHNPDMEEDEFLELGDEAIAKIEAETEILREKMNKKGLIKGFNQSVLEDEIEKYNELFDDFIETDLYEEIEMVEELSDDEREDLIYSIGGEFTRLMYSYFGKGIDGWDSVSVSKCLLETFPEKSLLPFLEEIPDTLDRLFNFMVNEKSTKNIKDIYATYKKIEKEVTNNLYNPEKYSPEKVEILDLISEITMTFEEIMAEED